jgi:hypothetical protein
MQKNLAFNQSGCCIIPSHDLSVTRIIMHGPKVLSGQKIRKPYLVAPLSMTIRT